jgi:predicted acyl esterase
MGHPRVRLTVTSPVPVAYVSAKLCDVFPDGTSALASRGLLNLTHRHGHDRPSPLEPGVPTEVEIELEATSWVLEPGHRVRLSLAGADWPNIWPPPHPSTLAVERSSVELVLPVLGGPSGLPRRLPPPGPERAPTRNGGERAAPVVWRFEDDVVGARHAP